VGRQSISCNLGKHVDAYLRVYFVDHLLVMQQSSKEQLLKRMNTYFQRMLLDFPICDLWSR